MHTSFSFSLFWSLWAETLSPSHIPSPLESPSGSGLLSSICLGDPTAGWTQTSSQADPDLQLEKEGSGHGEHRNLRIRHCPRILHATMSVQSTYLFLLQYMKSIIFLWQWRVKIKLPALLSECKSRNEQRADVAICPLRLSKECVNELVIASADLLTKRPYSPHGRPMPEDFM